jgi:hypothetical protein
LVANVQLFHRAPPSPHFAGRAENGETGLSPHVPLQLLHLRLDYQVYRFMGCDCHIEGYHKSLKQNVSLAKSPTQTVTTQTNHFFAALCGFIKLERLKGKTKLNHFALKAKLYLTALHSAFSTLRQLAPLPNPA